MSKLKERLKIKIKYLFEFRLLSRAEIIQKKLEEERHNLELAE